MSMPPQGMNMPLQPGQRVRHKRLRRFGVVSLTVEGSPWWDIYMNEAHVWWDGTGPLWTRLEDLVAE